MNFVKKVGMAAIGITLFSATLVCAVETPVFIRGTRVLGMGGAFTAISDDQNAMFFNPAGLTQRQGGQFTLFELQGTISEDALSFYQFYNDNKDKLEHFDSLSLTDKANLITDINNTITKYKTEVRVGLPNTSYVSGPGLVSWGLGVFDQADLGFQIRQGLLIPTIDVWGNIDVVCAIPLAHRFDSIPYNVPGKISVGITPKFIDRGKISDYGESILAFDNFNPVIQMGQGYGFDLGALYQPTDRWNVGLTVNDFGGTPISYARAESTNNNIPMVKEPFTGVIMPRWNLGGAYVPSKICYWPGKSFSTKDRLVLAVDADDLISDIEPLTDQSVYKKLHMGAEFRFYTLSLRAGFNSGYPCAGFGLGIPYVGLNIDYAYWADELGLYAGQQPQWNHQINISMKWGGMCGRAYGTDVKEKAAQAVCEPKSPKNAEPKKTETKTK
jgi:hypothetical protein